MVSIPGIPTTALVDISGWILSLKAMDQIMGVTTPLWENASQAMDSIGYSKFRRYWKVGRLLVALQTRLFVEEVMRFKGKPWSNLVTGFDTISQVGEGKPLSKREERKRRLMNQTLFSLAEQRKRKERGRAMQKLRGG